MLYYFAPMEGVTGYAFRRAHTKYFPPADRYFAPFFSPTREHVIPPRVLRELEPERNRGVPLVPQLLCRDPGDFIWAAGALADMGYAEINLNLGCPSGTVAAKGKGSGFLAFPEELDRFFDRVFSAPDMPRISVKTRLGIESPQEFPRLMEIYARYPICELIVHTRVRRDMYKLPAKPEHLAPALGFPGALSYNGDLFSVPDVRGLEKMYPRLGSIMLGRGAAANPVLFGLLRGETPPGRAALIGFHDEIYETCSADFGSRGSAVLRMKELWGYLRCLFPNSEKQLKRLGKTKKPGDYELAAREILSFAELDPTAAYAGGGQL